MGVILDLLGSFFVAGLILLIFFQYQADASLGLMEKSVELALLEEFRQTAEVLELDLRRAGVTTEAAERFSIMDEQHLVFKSGVDSDGDGQMDCVGDVEYLLGTTSQAGDTPNPDDRPLIRAVDGGEPKVIATHLIDWTISYLNRNGQVVAASAEVRMLQIEFTLTAAIPIADHYSSISYQKTIYLPNCL